MKRKRKTGLKRDELKPDGDTLCRRLPRSRGSGVRGEVARVLTRWGRWIPTHTRAMHVIAFPVLLAQPRQARKQPVSPLVVPLSHVGSACVCFPGLLEHR